MTSREKSLLLYDGACRFCELGSRTVVKWMPAGTIERADVNDPAIQNRYGISQEDAAREMYLVDDRGEITHGAWALRELLKVRAWTRPLALPWYVPGFPYVAQKVYLWIARHRYMFMRKVYKAEEPIGECDDGACSVHLGGPAHKAEQHTVPRETP